MNRELKGPMKRQPLSLRPHDVCVLLQFALKPEMTFRDLSDQVGRRILAARQELGEKMVRTYCVATLHPAQSGEDSFTIVCSCG